METVCVGCGWILVWQFLWGRKWSIVLPHKNPTQDITPVWHYSSFFLFPGSLACSKPPKKMNAPRLGKIGAQGTPDFCLNTIWCCHPGHWIGGQVEAAKVMAEPEPVFGSGWLRSLWSYFWIPCPKPCFRFAWHPKLNQNNFRVLNLG